LSNFIFYIFYIDCCGAGVLSSSMSATKKKKESH
jgi:hypothetical protein